MIRVYLHDQEIEFQWQTSYFEVKSKIYFFKFIGTKDWNGNSRIHVQGTCITHVIRSKNSLFNRYIRYKGV